MKLGKHVSIAGGIDKAPQRAKDLGCNCLQIFAKNPRGWKGRKLSDEEAGKVKEEMQNLGMESLIVHDTYLINLASPKEELWEKSLNGLKDDYRRAGMIGANYLVIHPGSHTGKGVEWGIDRISQGLNQLLENNQNQTMILLENVAGAGSAIGSNFQELYDIINNIGAQERLGICLDTCHAFAAGYNLAVKEGLEQMLDEFDRVLGLDRLKALHINDSVYPLSSNKDEHAHIGEGEIGLEGFSQLVNHPQLKDIPMILETPSFEGKDKDVEMILSLIK